MEIRAGGLSGLEGGVGLGASAPDPGWGGGAGPAEGGGGLGGAGGRAVPACCQLAPPTPPSLRPCLPARLVLNHLLLPSLTVFPLSTSSPHFQLSLPSPGAPSLIPLFLLGPFSCPSLDTAPCARSLPSWLTLPTPAPLLQNGPNCRSHVVLVTSLA